MRTFVRDTRELVRTKLRKYILTRDKGTCVYCNDPGEVIDHVIPLARNGPTIRGNLVVACKFCNRAKAQEIEEFYIAKAFLHLARKGESLKWLEDRI